MPAGDAAHQEGCDIQRLPGCKIVSQDDRNFGIKHVPVFQMRFEVALSEDVNSTVFAGLEHLCAPLAGDGILTAPAFPGIERIEAQF